MGFKHVYSSCYKSGHRRGVAILIANAVNYGLSEFRDEEGKYILLIGKVEGILVMYMLPQAADGHFTDT